METLQDVKRRKYIGVGGDDVPSLSVLEGDILRLIWDAGEPQSFVQVYEAMHYSRRRDKREMHSPTTITVTLSRMVERGLLTVERRPHGGKGYYGPTKTRAEVIAQALDDVSRRLSGQPIGYLLTRLAEENPTKPEKGAVSPEDAGYAELVSTLKKLQMSDNKPVPYTPEKY